MPLQRFNNPYISISFTRQLLELWQDQRILKAFPVSTAKNGPGERIGSECTPRGWHRIRAKIGAGLPLMSVFVGRRPTGEIYSPELSLKFPDRDWILTRILWLGGLEAGKTGSAGRIPPSDISTSMEVGMLMSWAYPIHTVVSA